LGNISAVTVLRFAIYLFGLVVLALAGVALTYWALGACAPPPLPGDELWTARQQLGEAVALVLRLGSKACFTADPFGAAGLWLGTRTAGLLLLLLALIVLWESVGRDLRRRFFVVRGGHVVLAGDYEDLRELAHRRRSLAGTFFLAPDRTAATEIARHRPFAEIVTLDSRKLARQLAGLGVAKARLLAAATRNDLTNVAIAEAGLATASAGELLVRLEQHSVRVFSSHRLRVRAALQDRTLSVVSLTQLQARRGMAAAMSGRYTMDGAPRVHIVLCGSGPALQAACFEVARQGFGLEREPPLLTILRTGASDFTVGALPRLQNAGIADIVVADVMTTAADGLDRAIADAVEGAPPPLAIHCISENAGEAEALAVRWEEGLLALHQPVPPIVAYAGNEHPLGSTGMIRIATAQDLAKAREVAQLMDQRARAVHQQYLDAQRGARAGKFGSAPAEVEWDSLPESFQDDNRNVADQMDYKLACVFMLARPGEGGIAFSRDETEVMSGIAHARWMAAKAIAGWRYGPERSDRHLIHPDMIPYGELAEPDKQKDRDVVSSLPDMAALAGESLHRERRVGVPRQLAGSRFESVVAQLRDTPKGSVAVAVLPLDDAGMIRLARDLLDAGLLIETVIDHWIDDLRADEAIAEPLADVLHRAWRIHVVREGNARGALDELVPEIVDEIGAIHAHP
jgi:hypothetical protein